MHRLQRTVTVDGFEIQMLLTHDLDVGAPKSTARRRGQGKKARISDLPSAWSSSEEDEGEDDYGDRSAPVLPPSLMRLDYDSFSPDEFSLAKKKRRKRRSSRDEPEEMGPGRPPTLSLSSNTNRLGHEHVQRVREAALLAKRSRQQQADAGPPPSLWALASSVDRARNPLTCQLWKRYKHSNPHGYIAAWTMWRKSAPGHITSTVAAAMAAQASSLQSLAAQSALPPPQRQAAPNNVLPPRFVVLRDAPTELPAVEDLTTVKIEK